MSHITNDTYAQQHQPSAYIFINISAMLQVVIPGIANTTPGAGTYVPNKVCKTVDEAQNYASEYVLMSLGMPYDGRFDNAVTVIYSPTRSAVC